MVKRKQIAPLLLLLADIVSKDAAAHNNLAEVYLDLEQLDEAIRSYRRSTELSPDDALNARVDLGVIAWHRGNEVEARTHFEAALSTLRRAQGRLWETAWQRQRQSPAGLLENKALALLGLGQQAEAVATLKEALAQRRPGDTIEFTRYDLLAAAPRPPEGLAEMRRLLEEAQA